jgi:hypothetical protein
MARGKVKFGGRRSRGEARAPRWRSGNGGQPAPAGERAQRRKRSKERKKRGWRRKEGVLPKAHVMRGRAPATSLVALLLAVSAAVTMVLAERGGPGPRAVSASSATSQDELFYSAGAVEREEELLQEARVTGEATSREQQTGRALLQFNDVGNIFSNGYGVGRRGHNTRTPHCVTCTGTALSATAHNLRPAPANHSLTVFSLV